MCCISWVAGGLECVAFHGMPVVSLMCCISWVAGGNDCIAFHGLQVEMNMLHFMGCRWE